MTQETIQLPAAPLQPPLLALRRDITKNYVQRLKLISKYGKYCHSCKNEWRIENLTVDHISPKFLCHNTHYNSDNNKQLLCIACHKQKS